MRILPLILAGFWLLGTFLLPGAIPPPQVEIAADLCALFQPSNVTDSSSCLVREPGSSGGVKMRAIFAHPAHPQRPAQVPFQLALPALADGERLLLALDYGLSDGIQFNGREDGVIFSVEVEGQILVTRTNRAMRWEPAVVDLTGYAGKSVTLALLTQAGKTLDHDWALWGNPRVLRFTVPTRMAMPTENGSLTLPITVGSLALQIAPGTRGEVLLQPNDGHPALKLALSDTGWQMRDFSWPGAAQVTLQWRLEAGAVIPWLGAYPARLEITQLNAAQAVLITGRETTLKVEVRNAGLGFLPGGQAQVTATIGDQTLAPQAVPALAPGEGRALTWPWKPTRPGGVDLKAQLAGVAQAPASLRSLAVYAAPAPAEIVALTNLHLRLEFVRVGAGFAYARVKAAQSNGWKDVATWQPLFKAVTRGSKGDETHLPDQVTATVETNGITLVATFKEKSGTTWTARLNAQLEPSQPFVRLRHEWRPDRESQVLFLGGPNLYIGDGTFGDAKTWGLFPGLEYLYGAERSSNERDFAPSLADRRTPHPHKVSIPLMAVTVGPDSQTPPAQADYFFTPDALLDQAPANARTRPPGLSAAPVTVALTWDPLAKWDGQHTFTSPRFASPNFDEGMRNHRLGLFLPSVPDFVAENGERARSPYPAKAGQPLVLESRLFVTPGTVMNALGQHLQTTGGIPETSPWPRSFPDTLKLCREGFLKTVWDEKTQLWSHCIGWPGGHAPGFATLLWLDAQATRIPDERRAVEERVTLVAENILKGPGAAGLMSEHGCHIMQWEFPFYYGHLESAWPQVDRQAQGLVRSQLPEGGWRYHPGNAEQAGLGRTNDSVLGTCARHASILLRHARITGDTNTLAAGEKALRFMEQFRVPRGGQTWECPMYEPDILAAAYAVRAYHDGYRATGNARWLHNAVYWAETGVPFLYLWTLPDKPMMLGGALPVFGSTFYTHTWLAVPVQWCGLVYSYHVLHLARELAKHPLPATDSPLPLALNLTPQDWERLVRHITISGLYQQVETGDKIGTYPDSISDFERRNPVFINPENLLANVFALWGMDPDVKTLRRKTDLGEVVVSSGANLLDLTQPEPKVLKLSLSYFSGHLSHTMLTGLRLRGVRVNGKEIPFSVTPPQRREGWYGDPATGRIFLSLPHQESRLEVDLELE
jgi:hypothetical protein